MYAMVTLGPILSPSLTYWYFKTSARQREFNNCCFISLMHADEGVPKQVHARVGARQRVTNKCCFVSLMHACDGIPKCMRELVCAPESEKQVLLRFANAYM